MFERGDREIEGFDMRGAQMMSVFIVIVLCLSVCSLLCRLNDNALLLLSE